MTPSYDRRDPRAGWVPRVWVLGQNGRRRRALVRLSACRECGGPIPVGRRRTFCSDACVETWKIRTSPAHVRKRVLERDHGVCSDCGLDLREVRAELQDMRRFVSRGQYSDAEYWIRQQLNSLNRYWQAHHAVAVAEGGGLCGLDQYRTLCRRCHGRETGALRRRLNARKKGLAPAACRAAQ